MNKIINNYLKTLKKIRVIRTLLINHTIRENDLLQLGNIISSAIKDKVILAINHSV